MIRAAGVRNHPPEAPHPAPAAGGRAGLRGVLHPGRLRRPVHHRATTSGPLTPSGCRRRSTGGPGGGRHRGTPAREAPLQDPGHEAHGRRAGERADRAALQRRRDAGDGVPRQAGPGLPEQRRRRRAVLDPAGRRDAADRARRRALRRRRLCLRPPRAAPPAHPGPGAAELAVDGAQWRAALADPVAQRGGPAADGRPLQPPRLQAARVQGSDGRGHPRPGGEEGPGVPRLPLPALSARHRRAGTGRCTLGRSRS